MIDNYLEQMWSQAMFNRYFEFGAAQGLKEGKVNPPIYLSVGTEMIPIVLKEVLKDCGIKKANIFIQHRCHSYYLTFAGRENAIKLAYELCGDERGCNKGWAGSASISYNEGEFQLWGHSGLLGDQVPIAAGAAHASDIPTICIMGDAAAEEDYALGALGYAASKNAPILFICEDNNLSVLTTKAERRSWELTSVAEGFDIHCLKSSTKSWSGLYKNLKNVVETAFIDRIPSLIEIKCCRHLWHAGIGKDNEPEWDAVEDLGKLINNREEIQNREQLLVNEIWDEVKSSI